MYFVVATSNDFGVIIDIIGILYLMVIQKKKLEKLWCKTKID